MHYGVGGNLSRPAHTTPSYGYDAVRRLSAITWGIVGSQYTYDTLSRLSKLTTTRSGANMAVTALTYNSLGGLKTDGTWSYTWEHGRHLKKMISDDASVFFYYDADGHRVRKTVNGQDTEYYYQGDRLIEVKQGSTWLHYNYDSVGPASTKYVDTIYYFLRNAQGDVLGIVDSWGNEVVRYTYDAWGNILSTTGSMANTLGKLNVLRYRGYVYDAETGLYYLNSRYYNPSWGRFINADVFVSTGQGVLGSNMFAYCLNNPVNYCDSIGTMAGKTNNYICADYSPVAHVYYDSIEAAARAFGEAYYRKAMHDGVEYEADIIAVKRQNTVNYYLSEAHIGTNIDVDLGMGQLPYGFAGSVHFHVYGPKNDWDHFSDNDIALMNTIIGDQRPTPYEFYVILPDRSILGFGSIDNELVGQFYVGRLSARVLGGMATIRTKLSLN